jgi:hypothetical protein
MHVWPPPRPRQFHRPGLPMQLSNFGLPHRDQDLVENRMTGCCAPILAMVLSSVR